MSGTQRQGGPLPGLVPGSFLSLRKLCTRAAQVPADELLDQRSPVGAFRLRCRVQVGPVLVADAHGAVLGSRLVGHAPDSAGCTDLFQRGLLVVYVHLGYRGVRTPVRPRAVLENIESGRRDKDGRRRHYVTVEELRVLADALGFSPAEVLGDAPAATAGVTAVQLDQMADAFHAAASALRAQEES